MRAHSLDVPSLDVLCVGETMGLVVQDPAGPLGAAATARFAVGGAESNVATCVARLGARAAWVSRLGTDAIGDLVVRTLRGEGVEVHALRDPSRTTGMMVKTRRKLGHSGVSYYRSESAATQLGLADVPDELLGTARFLHLSGVLPALGERTLQFAAALIARARRLGVKVSYDINFRSTLWDSSDASAFTRAVLPNVDVLFGGLDELALIDQRYADRENVFMLIPEYGLEEVVVKLGAEGAFAVAEGENASAASYEVDVIDTVGAGDAFVGGYLSGFAERLSMGDRLDRAVYCGALQCTVPGDWEGTPTKSELSVLARPEVVER